MGKNIQKLRDKILLELAIDDDDLPGERAKQSALSFYWSSQADLAGSILSQLRTAKAELEARLARKFRTQNSKNIKPSFMDKSVKEYVTCHKDVMEASQQVIKAEYEYNVLQSARYSFAQRAHMLRSLTDEKKAYGSVYEPDGFDEQGMEEE